MDNQILKMIQRSILVILSTISLLFFTYFSWIYLQPFIFAILLSVFFQPFIQLFNTHLRIPRGMSILLVLFIFGGLAGGLLALLVAEIIRGIQYLAAGVPGHFSLLTNYLTQKVMNTLSPLLSKGQAFTDKLSVNQQQTLEEYLKVAQDKFSETSLSLLNSALEATGIFLAELPSSFAFVFITLLATFFICKDWNIIMKFLKKVFPETLSARMYIFQDEFIQTIKGLIRAQCMLVMISTSIIATGLLIIGAPHPLTITFLAALVDFIPYVGTGIIFIPWIIYQFLTGEFMMTIGLSILYMVVILTRQTLEPKLLADHFGVPPIILLISLFLGFQLFGGLGMLISPIALMTVQTLVKTGVTKEIWSYIIGRP
ncbi:sporulation integral membrane protein YtvI [Halobacillus litoralis]|uniref:Sporulation integral membrane protein YtvI n=1 Tax=Halobacillus litoralis TaxID=45668 RepID=A0A845FGG3_9BACI|nr:sporulation integral membrane protein YtvI [Halobacillus litoralis]MYL72617.1 sporulation integral membrane protein YtvI [Halobacillus litoralis]